MQGIALQVRDVSKVYKIYDREIDRLWEGLHQGKKIYHKSVHALSQVNFEVQRGTTFGILGRNGSGKSTLLQIIAGVLQPSSGEVHAYGRISALLELGSGFNSDFTGIENIYLYSRILGLTDKEIDAKLETILDFADIGDFASQPLRTYSSGMAVRLAFATAVSVDPEILIVDEALAVGDAYFQHKCILRMKEIIQSGATVLFVSHDIHTVKSLCQEAMLLEDGKAVIQGKAEDVANEYHRRLFERDHARGIVGRGAFVEDAEEAASLNTGSRPEFLFDSEFEARARKNRFGNGTARLTAIEVLNGKGQRVEALDYGEKMTVRVHCEFLEPAESAVIGMILRDAKGSDLIGINTLVEKKLISKVAAGERITIDFLLPNLLGPGSYSLACAVTDEAFFHQPYYRDWVNNCCVIHVSKPQHTIVYGVFLPPDTSVEIWRAQDTSSTRKALG